MKTTKGGAWALRQMRCLRASGIQVDVLLPNDDGLAATYRSAGVNVHILQIDIAQLRNPLELLSTQSAFRDLISTLSPDIIHSHFVGTTIFMRTALRNSGPIRVFQVPGPLHLENAVTRHIELSTSGFKDRWIASCQFTRDAYLRAGIGPERIGLSYYGIDLSEFSLKEALPLRRILNIPEGTKIVGMVAYMYAPRRLLGQRRGIKGHEDLIDSVRLLLDMGRDCVAVFVGGAWIGGEAYEREVKSYASARLGDRAIFLGSRTDVANIYPSFDVAVHPSHSENLGGAVESLALGVPTIATRVGGFPDIVIPGKTGWLVPPRSPALLSAALLEALDQPGHARQLALEGGKIVRNLLDVNRNAVEVRECYERFLSG